MNRIMGTAHLARWLGVLFVFLFVTGCATGRSYPSPQEIETTLESIMANANPANGAAIVEEYSCGACHISYGDAPVDLAPSFTELRDVAGERRPELSAEAYVYESIVYPEAHLVEGYIGNMPTYYALQMTEDELGDLIAYLLSEQVSELYEG